MHIYIKKFSYTHTYIHTHIHAYIHTYIHTYAYIRGEPTGVLKGYKIK